jgi:hypothetical protein
MMVKRREEQAGVLVQAVQNHNPDVIIVDEIGTAKVLYIVQHLLQHVLARSHLLLYRTPCTGHDRGRIGTVPGAACCYAVEADFYGMLLMFAGEIAAARTVCELGMLLMGTAHGSSLSTLL